MEEKSAAKQLKEKLLQNKKNMGAVLSDEEIASAMEFCEGYKKFLDHGKTEREAVSTMVEMLEQNGYVPFVPGTKYQTGDKVYCNNRGKALVMAVVGRRPLEEGVHIAASHIDSPRLDLKPNPLYEEAQLALFKTHYYGGIKKYQWTAIPLSLHGVVCKKNGEKVTISLGEDPQDPVFCVTDLLPHLASDQVKRPLHEGIRGEELNVLVGSLPFKDDEISEAVKLNIMNLIYEKYGFVEEDFFAAELELVPAFPAKDLGFDRSLVGAYGQDDRVCAYTSFMAALDCGVPETTLVTVFADKEETGSEGNTGLQAAYLRYFIADLAKPYGVDGRTVLSHSTCLSADVNAAFDPTFADAYERNNSAYINYGVVLTKYTGARGKSGTSDASAEFVAAVRKIMDDAGVIWQTGELGKVDQGGGGTVAALIANLDVDVIDVGVPVLSMHAPFEVTAKLDVYMTYRAFKAFAQA
ncbi:MAG: aminopeptidase [Massiliimalia sp.]|jgi:aspartyl aminopeptidase